MLHFSTNCLKDKNYFCFNKLSTWIVLIVLLLFIDLSAAFAQDPIVYSRCERTSTEMALTGEVTINGTTKKVTRSMRGLDIYDVLPDVTNFLGNFTAPCDLVLRDSSGTEKIIYNCSANSSANASCAALDPAVSFDGKTIAFSVFHGSLKQHKKKIDARVLHPDADKASLGWKELPNKRLVSKGAHLHFYNIELDETRTIPYTEGIYDSGPAFLSNTRVAFTSTRDNNATTRVWRTNSIREGTRIWNMDLDGRNIKLASHHSLSQEQHPYPLKDGRLAYSSWQIFGGLPFRHTNGRAGGFTTLDNLFHIYTQAPDGAGNFPLYGQHSGNHVPSSFGEDHNASHFITQTSDGRVWFADYYRGNNKGLGILVGVMPEPKGQEGIGPLEATQRSDIYLPRDVINFADWGHNGDNFSKIMELPELVHPNYADPLPFAGKLGHPAATPGNGLMLAWGKGPCSTVAGNKQVFAALGKTVPPATSGSGQGVAMNYITSLEIDTPGCDVGLYRANVVPSVHPSDLEMIVDSPDWHEIMGRVVVPYSVIHGVERPEIIERADELVSHPKLETGTPFGLLGAASITDRETHPRDGIHFAGEHQFHSQGTDTIEYADEDLCGVRILGVMPNRYVHPNKLWNKIHEFANIAGERVSILGEFSVLNRDANGKRLKDSSGHPDTSFLARIPANTPYLMQGIDCDGRTLNTDQTWQHLRPGEVKTCDGCHVHSRPARTKFNQTFAATNGYVIPQLGEGTVSLLAGKVGDTVNTRTVPGYGVQVDFTRDVLPIFEKRCASCHSGNSPKAGLALDRSGILGIKETTMPSTWWCLVADSDQKCVPSGQRLATNAGFQGTTFRRPQLTRYVRAFNSRGSLLYWKAANKRTDNATDGSHGDDIDFGDAHPTKITPAELGVLSRWIDIGAGGGAEELKDTQKPTLHLAAIIKNGAVTGLRVGTVDLGSGIRADSLVVCVVSDTGACNNVAGSAEAHGITSVVIGSALSNLNTRVFASVQDLAGNVTEVDHTVAWFLGKVSLLDNTPIIPVIPPEVPPLPSEEEPLPSEEEPLPSEVPSLPSGNPAEG